MILRMPFIIIGLVIVGLLLSIQAAPGEDGYTPAEVRDKWLLIDRVTEEQDYLSQIEVILYRGEKRI